MFQIIISRSSFSQASKYVFIIDSNGQTKRTEVCHLWTSCPQFSSIIFDQLTNIKFRACEASIDRKLKVIGSFQIKQTQLSFSSDEVFNKQKQIHQNIEGHNICLGRCQVLIIRKYGSELDQIQKSKQNVENEKGQDQDDSFELHSSEENDGEIDELRNMISVEIHFGRNFYLNSSFSIEMHWGKQKATTKSIKDKINPVWSESLALAGNPSKEIIMYCHDHLHNKLEKFKFNLNSLRLMIPYHFKLLFKEEYMGARPEIYFTIRSNQHPHFSITEKPITFTINNISDSVLTINSYLILTPKTQLTLPTFLELDLNQIVTLQRVNQFISNTQKGDQDMIYFLPIQNNSMQFTLLKSTLNRNIDLHFLSVTDFRLLSEGKKESCKIIETKREFQKMLRRIYQYLYIQYSHNEVYTIKKYIQIFCKKEQAEEEVKYESVAERWKVLSNNYVLRVELLNKSINNTHFLREEIQNKGKYLVELKKILNQVRTINNSLAQKQKLAQGGSKLKKQRFNEKQFATEEIISALIEKQAQLSFKSKRNDQLSIRMSSLNQIQENSEEVDDQIVENSKKIHKQQQLLTLMEMMKKTLPKQREMIGELEKVFQQKEIDKSMNQVLQNQTNKLNSIRQAKITNLENVYQLVKNKNIGNSLLSKVRETENTLIRLNEIYAKASLI